MAQPTTYTWGSALQVLAPSQVAVKGIPLVFSKNIPSGQVRVLNLFGTAEGTGTPTGSAKVTIVGLDEFSQILTLKDFDVAVGNNYATKLLSQIISITPTLVTTDASTTQFKISASIGGPGDSGRDFTKPYLCDVWNQQALYSYSVNVIAKSASGKITPQYAFDPLPNWNKRGNQVGAQPDYSVTWIDMDTLTNPPITLGSPSKKAFSFSDFPITAIRFLVDDSITGTGAFTATIMQQGGFF
jgi:hypothetical protein